MFGFFYFSCYFFCFFQFTVVVLFLLFLVQYTTTHIHTNRLCGNTFRFEILISHATLKSMLQRIRPGSGGKVASIIFWMYGWHSHLVPLFGWCYCYFSAAFSAAYADLINLSRGLARCPGNLQTVISSRFFYSLTHQFDVVRLRFFGLFMSCFRILGRQWHAFFVCVLF